MSGTAVLDWLLHTLLGGGCLLLLAWLWMRRLAAPARRQRLGEWGVLAALLLAILSLAPAWLVVPLPAPVIESPPPAIHAATSDSELPPVPTATHVETPDLAEPSAGEGMPPPIIPEMFPAASPEVFPDALSAPSSQEQKSIETETAAPTGGESITHRLIVVLSALYLSAAALLLARWLLGHIVLWRMLRQTEPVPPVVAELFASLTSSRPRPRLVLSRRTRVPFSCGLLRPMVVLPAGMVQGAAQPVLHWVFAHELTHLRRRDAWAGVLFGLGQALYFPLPWFWWLRRQVRLCQEYIADAAAAAVGCPADYAQFLLSWTAAPAAPASVLGVSGSASDLFRRITMLLHAPAPLEPRCPRRWLLPAAGALLSLAVFLAGLGFTTQAAPLPNKDETKKANAKTDEPKKTEIGKDKIEKEQAPKDSADDLDELFKNAPPGLDPQVLKQMRTNLEQALRRASPEQAKQLRQNMARTLQQMAQRGPGVGLAPGRGASFPGLLDPRTARLGAWVEPPSPTLAEQLELPKGQGLVLREVLRDSPAAKAGLKAHDILLELNGKPVPDQLPGLVGLLADLKPNSKVDVVVLRKGKKETLKGLTLPEVKAGPPGVGGFVPPRGAAGQPGGPAGGFPGGSPPAGVGGFMPPGGGQAVITTMFRTAERFTLRHQEGSLIITLTGKVADGKAKVSEIHVQDGLQAHQYESLDKVPQQYQDKAKNLMEMSEKSNGRLDIKSP